MRKTTIEIPLVGGLGNQLFILAFGVFVAENWGLSVRLIQTSSFKGNQTHGNRISSQISLDGLPVQVVDQTKLGRFVNSFGRVFSRIASSSGRQILNRVYLSEDEFLNFPDSVRQMLPPRTYQIHGYFQEPTYLAHVQRLGFLKDLKVASPSVWFQEAMRDLKSERRVCIHVRRGDTLKIPNYGILSVDYYRKAILALSEGQRRQPILVFSDEPDALRNEFSSLADIATLDFIYPPEDSAPIESLLLMAQCPTLIMSNSTFSWWSANLGEPSKLVISPQTWSPSGKKGLLPAGGRKWRFLAPAWMVNLDQ